MRWRRVSAAKDAMAQILINSRMCAEGHRPICQDTGIVTAFVKVGMEVQWEPGMARGMMTMQEMVDEGVREAWRNADNVLRPSILEDPAFTRQEYRRQHAGDGGGGAGGGRRCRCDGRVEGRGVGGEEPKFAMLNPSDSVVDWVLKTVPGMGAGWCPPGMLGIGIGGTAEKAMVMAKESLMDPIDMQELIARGPKTKIEEMRIEIYNKVNRLGIGAQGLGGLTTVLDVKIMDFPTHAANLPVAMIPNCAATRHLHFKLDGSGPVMVDPPSLDAWPKLEYDVHSAKRVDLDTITHEDVKTWKPGEVCCCRAS